MFKKFIIILTLICLLCSCGVRKSENNSEKDFSCYLTIKCDSILNNMNTLKKEKKELIPEKGIFLENEVISFDSGDTVFDILSEACKQNKLILNTEKNLSGSVYVEGINNIIYGDCGPLSGWIFYINGESAVDAANKIVVNNGDKIEWRFICDMEKEI